MNNPPEASDLLAKAVDHIDTGRQLGNGSIAQQSKFVEAHALAAIASASALLDIRSELYSLREVVMQAADAADSLSDEATFEDEQWSPDAEPEPETKGSPFLNKGLRIMSNDPDWSGDAPALHGVITGEAGMSEGTVWWPVLWDGHDASEKVWQSLLTPEPAIMEEPTTTIRLSEEIIADAEADGEPNDDDWAPLPAGDVFAEAKANPTTKKKGSKK